jgi:hypothetical protein
MGKKKIMTMANVSKLNKVVSILQNFTAAVPDMVASGTPNVDGPVLSITDIYTVGNLGNQVTFDLLIRTKGAGALTDAVLHKSDGTDMTVITGARDSLSGIALGTDSSLNGIFLKIKSVVSATNLTPVPTALDVMLSMSGGQVVKSFPLPPRQFNAVGNSFIIDYTIIIFQA